MSIDAPSTIKYLDVFYKIAMIIIALFNVIFAVYIFRLRNKKDDSERERDRSIQLLKTLVLDHNLKYFYSDFDEIEFKLLELKKTGLNDLEKSQIDSDVAELFITIRRRFFDSLLAIDPTLYETIVDFSDELQEHLTNAIFNQGINLSHSPKYDEIIKEKIINTKTDILRELFNYRGSC